MLAMPVTPANPIGKVPVITAELGSLVFDKRHKLRSKDSAIQRLPSCAAMAVAEPKALGKDPLLTAPAVEGDVISHRLFSPNTAIQSAPFSSDIPDGNVTPDGRSPLLTAVDGANGFASSHNSSWSLKIVIAIHMLPSKDAMDCVRAPIKLGKAPLLTAPAGFVGSDNCHKLLLPAIHRLPLCSVIPLMDLFRKSIGKSPSISIAACGSSGFRICQRLSVTPSGSFLAAHSVATAPTPPFPFRCRAG